MLTYGQKNLNGMDNGENEAMMFIEDLFGLKKSDIFLMSEYNMSDEDFSRYKKAIEKRLKGVPYNYIVGFKEFYDRKFLVDERVLVPRQETELMIDFIERYYTENPRPKRILDLCTGSGVIAITIEKIFGRDTYASDISDYALQVAKMNAKNLNSNVHFIQSDLFDNIEGKFDLITINPPYVPRERKKLLSKEVRDFEPDTAIFTDDDGLYIIKRFLDEFINFVESQFLVIMEIDETHKDKIINYLKNRNRNLN
ncbi:MAG: peptide chain release factor N(5)-glutamine methyltransferase [Ezakiella sp.]